MRYDRGDLVFLPIRPNDDFVLRLATQFYIRHPDDLVDNIFLRNGEYCPTIRDVLERQKGEKRLHRRRACIVHSYTQSESDVTKAFGQILLMADAASKAGADEVYLILAEHMFDRQDLDPDLKYDDEYLNLSEGKRRKIEKMQGQPFSLEVAVKHFHAAGIKKVLTLDGHSEALNKVYERIFQCNPDHVLFNLDPVPIFVNYLLSLDNDGYLGDNGSNLVLVGPDKGSWKALKRFYDLSGLVNASLVYCNKYRTAPNDPKKIEAAIEKTSENFNGVEGKIVVGLDDKGDTLGTLRKTLVLGLSDHGTPKQLHAMLSHLIFSTREAYELVADSRINVHGSNSHPNIIFKKNEPGVRQISVLDFTPYFAWALVNNLLPGKPLPIIDNAKDLGMYKDFYKVAKQERFVDFS